MRNSTVEIIRHTYDSFEVVAYDLFGRIVRHRMYCHGKKRKAWAIEQAALWAEELYLWVDPTIYH